MTTLTISGLRAGIDGRDILTGVDLEVRSGEVHAVMGPNGAGKSTLSAVIMGKPGYEVRSGSVTLDGTDVLAMAAWERAAAGLFLALQYPVEVPGVSLEAALFEAIAARGGVQGDLRARMEAEALRIGFDARFLERPLNVDLSGGEKKRNETLQLAVLEPRIAILDELDSGLDVDALRACTRRVQAATEEGLGVLAITHYSRLFHELEPDVVHVLVKGQIVASGGPELADRIEQEGYAPFLRDGADGENDKGRAQKPDPFADPFV